jgi:hypothetical protein
MREITKRRCIGSFGGYETAQRHGYSNEFETQALPGAKIAFKALSEGAIFVSELPKPIACHYNLAVAETGLGNSKEALSWIRLSEQEQNQLGRTVIPGLSENRQKLESTMTTHEHE